MHPNFCVFKFAVLFVKAEAEVRKRLDNVESRLLGIEDCLRQLLAIHGQQPVSQADDATQKRAIANLPSNNSYDRGTHDLLPFSSKLLTHDTYREPRSPGT